MGAPQGPIPGGPSQPQLGSEAVPPHALVGPSNLLTLVAVGEAAGKSWVVLRCETPVGSFMFTMEAAHAKQLGLELGQAADMARTGLVLAGPQAVPKPPG